MCEFISWIKKDGLTLYLTHDDIYNTKKGKELQKFCGCEEDGFTEVVLLPPTNWRFHLP